MAIDLKFLIILVFALLLRIAAFYIPHDGWDQIYYTSLAMKLDTLKLSDYNLRDVSIKELSGAGGREIYKSSKSPNDLLHEQKRYGLYMYDEPLFCQPPGLSFLIKISHDLLAQGKGYVYSTHRAFYYAKKRHFPYFFSEEIYKSIIPLTFSLLTICLVYWFSVTYINLPTAYFATLFLAVNPVDIMSASKVWTDTMASFFFALTLILFYMAYKKNNVFIMLLSALACAAAIWTRTPSLFLIPIVFFIKLYYFELSPRKSIWELVDIKIILFLLAVFTLTLPWFELNVRLFGSPMHIANQKNLGDLFPFVYYVMHRPWYTYPVNIFCQNPLWVLCFFIPFFPIDRQIRFLLCVWSITPILILSLLPRFAFVSIEDRYALPSYPAICLAAGYVLSQIHHRYNQVRWVGIVLNILTGLSILLSVIIAVYYVYYKMVDCIPFPC